jgi:phosphoadenylyl-sulfate reductase (thioredoxin)
MSRFAYRSEPRLVGAGLSADWKTPEEIREPPPTRQPGETLAWAAKRFPRIAFATGFGVEGCVLIDVIARHSLPIDIFTLDTGLLFPETHALWRRLEKRYGVTIRAVLPEKSVSEQAAELGERLWERSPDRCCRLRKIVPLRAALANFDAWITSIRRDQTRQRSGASVIEWDQNFGLVKVNPLVRWNSREIWAYVRQNEVPFNPLHERGYPSIGCVPCTSPVRPGEDPRSGRWRGREKTECGIHAGNASRDSGSASAQQETSGDPHAR